MQYTNDVNSPLSNRPVDQEMARPVNDAFHSAAFVPAEAEVIGPYRCAKLRACDTSQSLWIRAQFLKRCDKQGFITPAGRGAELVETPGQDRDDVLFGVICNTQDPHESVPCLILSLRGALPQ